MPVVDKPYTDSDQSVHINKAEGTFLPFSKAWDTCGGAKDSRGRGRWKNAQGGLEPLMVMLGLGFVSLPFNIPKWFSRMHVVNRVEVSKQMNSHSDYTRHEHAPPPVIYTSKTKLHETNNAKTVMSK